MKCYEGKIKGQGRKIAIVVSRFNDFITERLLEGCLRELEKNGLKKSEVVVAWVPGSLEIPVMAQQLAKKRTIQAVICLGAVIRGETIHFDLVAQQAAQGIARVALDTGKPVIFGILTTDTADQAYKRSDARGDHKGRDAARSALEMIDVMAQVKN